MQQEDSDSPSQLLDLRSSARSGLGAADDANSQPFGLNNNLEVAPPARSAAQSAGSHAFVVQWQVHPAPFSHSPLVFRPSTTARFPRQQIQAVSSICGGSRSPSDVRSTPRGRPVSPRRRSRSPTTATRSIVYRDRSPELNTASRHDADAPGRSARPRVVCDSAEVARRLRLDRLAREKNNYGVCVTCWLKELPCDHQWPCGECIISGTSCAYIACPLDHCPLDHKCPCHHTKRIPLESIPTREVGSSLHLAVLLNLGRLSIDSYDLSGMQMKLQNSDRAQQIYFQLQPELQSILQQGKTLHEHQVRKLIRELDKVPRLAVRAVKTISRLIVELIEEKK